MKTKHVIGVREDHRTGQFIGTIDGIDVSPTSFDEHRALQIAREQVAKMESEEP